MSGESNMARGGVTGAPPSGSSSIGGHPSPAPGAPDHLTERELPDEVAERIAEGHAGLLAHGRRVHAEHGGRDLDRPADDDDLRVVEETNVPVAHQRDWNNEFVRRVVLRVRQEQTRAEKAEAALAEIGQRAYSVPGRMNTNDSICTQRRVGEEQFAAEILFLIAEHGYGQSIEETR